MKVFMVLLIAILQLIVGSVLGFAGALLLGVGNGWELVVFVVGYSLGVWGTGTLASLRLGSTIKQRWIRLGTTLIVSMVGVLVLLATAPIGFVKAVYPLFGALIGYYLPSFFKTQVSADRA